MFRFFKKTGFTNTVEIVCAFFVGTAILTLIAWGLISLSGCAMFESIFQIGGDKSTTNIGGNQITIFPDSFVWSLVACLLTTISFLLKEQVMRIMKSIDGKKTTMGLVVGAAIAMIAEASGTGFETLWVKMALGGSAVWVFGSLIHKGEKVLTKIAESLGGVDHPSFSGKKKK